MKFQKKLHYIALKTAKENNGCQKLLLKLNPAPANEKEASEISKEFFKVYIDFFTPNETEAEFYTYGNKNY